MIVETTKATTLRELIDKLDAIDACYSKQCDVIYVHGRDATLRIDIDEAPLSKAIDLIFK